MPAKAIERNRNHPDGRNRVCLPPASQPMTAKKFTATPWEAAHESQTLRGAPIRRETWQATTIPKPHFMCARSATASKECSPNIARARPIGDENAQQSTTCSEGRSETVRPLSRKVWSHPVLLVANSPLFKEVR